MALFCVFTLSYCNQVKFGFICNIAFSTDF